MVERLLMNGVKLGVWTARPLCPGQNILNPRITDLISANSNPR